MLPLTLHDLPFEMVPSEARMLVETMPASFPSSNYTLYGDMQRRVVAAVEEFTSAVEIYSTEH